MATAMNLPAGAPVYHSIILHRNRAAPVQLENRSVNPNLAPEYLKQDFTALTPRHYLLGLAPETEVEHVIEAVMPDEQTRVLLDMEAGDPCRVLNRRTWTYDLVATKSRFTHPASRHRLGSRFKPSAAHQSGLV